MGKGKSLCGSIRTRRRLRDRRRASRCHGSRAQPEVCQNMILVDGGCALASLDTTPTFAPAVSALTVVTSVVKLAGTWVSGTVTALNSVTSGSQYDAKLKRGVRALCARSFHRPRTVSVPVKSRFPELP